MKCETCGINEAKNQVCNGDQKLHYHGRVHTADDKMLALCDDCLSRDAVAWDKRFKERAYDFKD